YRVRLQLSQGLRIDPVNALQSLVAGQVAEALLLDPGHVDDVDRGQDRLEVLGLGPAHAALVEVVLDVLAHGHLGRSDEPDLDIAVPAPQVGQAADGAPVGEVADHRDLDPVDAAQLSSDGVDVEQSLRPVPAPPAAGGDHSHLA